MSVDESVEMLVDDFKDMLSLVELVEGASVDDTFTICPFLSGCGKQTVTGS